eukprot:GILK01003777.1.p1 GENE.GILK01003777.1~~GILK01003777.1.p1  ORF type:complete len:341 (+),score=22.66 GILK01003777.1:48-1025(+)
MAQGTWRRIVGSGEAPSLRSSHTVSIVSPNKVICYGGEDNVPRNAFDDNIYELDVASRQWTKHAVNGAKPDARLGHSAAFAGDSLYVFAGRGSGSVEYGSFLSYNIHSRVWSEIDAANAPSTRSYHASCSVGSSVYVFAGWTKAGRLNDLYRFDTATQSWHTMPSQGVVPSCRGGPAFCGIPKPGNPDAHLLFVAGGFNGVELGDFFMYDTELQSWSQPATNGDMFTPRSVTFLTALDDSKLFLFGGEAGPSARGHEGAGAYLDDAYIFDIPEQRWRRVTYKEDSDTPSARGWLAGGALDASSVFVFGGFDGNSRLDDSYIFTLE